MSMMTSATGAPHNAARSSGRATPAAAPAARTATTTAPSTIGLEAISAAIPSARQYAHPAPARAVCSALKRRR